MFGGHHKDVSTSNVNLVISQYNIIMYGIFFWSFEKLTKSRVYLKTLLRFSLFPLYNSTVF